MNNWILSGRLGRDAETRTLQSGKTVVSFSIATDEYRKNANGESEKQTLWTSVSWFNGGGLVPYLKKGAVVLVEGRPTARAYTNKEGQPACALEMLANRIEMMSFAADGEKPADLLEQPKQAQQQPQPTDKLPF
jgi:single-strand DNA-binding protein